ncbi:MAG: Gfo/Idh/MocA family protein [Hydrogeniiclostridium mannosilyticum]
MIKVGIAGARGLSNLLGLRAIPDVEVSAICDLDEDVLNQMAEEHHIPNRFRVFDDMLETDIDAVIISTPMQCHVPQAIAALEAGKHVFSEVTAGVTMDELWWLIENVEASGKVYMYAENYCYTPYNQLIRAMVQKGMFGTPYYAEGEYLHDVKSMTTYHYDIHQSGKTSRKYSSWENTAPSPHTASGLMQGLRAGSPAYPRLPAALSPWTARGHYHTMCQMASGKLARIRVDCISPRPHNMTFYQLQGTKGVVETPRGLGDVCKVWLEDYNHDENKDDRQWRPLSDFNSLLPERYKNATEEQKKAGHEGGDFFIVEDFINAIRYGTKPAIDVYQACEWTAVGLLSELSVTNGGRAIDIPHFRKNMPYEEQHISLR